MKRVLSYKHIWIILSNCYTVILKLKCQFLYLFTFSECIFDYRLQFWPQTRTQTQRSYEFLWMRLLLPSVAVVGVVQVVVAIAFVVVAAVYLIWPGSVYLCNKRRVDFGTLECLFAFAGVAAALISFWFRYTTRSLHEIQTHTHTNTHAQIESERRRERDKRMCIKYV